MSEPLISVIIPTYNRPEQLRTCLAALSAQTLERSLFEVIVVDDGGEPPLGRDNERLGEPLDVRVMRQPNAGPAAARNAGAGAAKGRWLAFTDDDCLPEAGWLEALRRSFEKYPEAMFGGTTVNVLSGNPYSECSQLIQDFVYGYYNANPERARFFASNNLALPADGFRSLGGFNPGFRTSEDRDLCDRWRAGQRMLKWEPSAVVGHAHELTMTRYWQQHHGYGRGARRFQLARRSRGGRSSIESAFYVSLALRLPGALGRHRMPFRMAGLLALWQAANVAGWLAETMESRRADATR